jgi:hypothetical protein
VFRREANTVAALIVEPIQGEGGDRHASAAFFRALRALCLKHDVLFVADEVQTAAGATGRFWAHEHWGLEVPPDLVTWSKKFQFGGVHARPEVMPAEPYRIFQTFLGDPFRLAQWDVMLEVIRRDRLVEHTASVGRSLVAGLERLCAGGWFSNARGQGTFAAVDVPTGDALARILGVLRAQGVECGGSGTRTIRFRPALVFAQRHVDEVLEHLLTAQRAAAQGHPVVMHVVHSPRYFAELGEHVMPIRKFGLVREAIERTGLPVRFEEPQPADDEALLLVHTPEYVQAVDTGEPLRAGAVAEVPVVPRPRGGGAVDERGLHRGPAGRPLGGHRGEPRERVPPLARGHTARASARSTASSSRSRRCGPGGAHRSAASCSIWTCTTATARRRCWRRGRGPTRCRSTATATTRTPRSAT